MNQLIAKEFLWLLFALVVSIPLGFLFLYMLGYTDYTANVSETEKDYITLLYLIGYVVSLVGIYLIRLIAAAISTLAAGPSEEEAAA